ncbi:MAG: hypothetical protein H0U87_00430 [Acidobacteria bacterium]|jgi:hypothetical protein|nr:hypothetical protein [Acidobacteriota bacterium]
MENEEKQSGEKADAMNKQQETMPDGKRYIIYYTFGEEEGAKCGGEAKNEAAAAASEISAPESVEKEVKNNV